VEDSAWVEVTTESSKWQGNLISNPRLATPRMNNGEFSGSCFSLESPKEAEPFDTSVFKKSVYLKVETKSDLGELSYEFEGYGFSYQFFEGDHNDTSSWRLIDSFSNLKAYSRQTSSFKSICDGVVKSDTKYFFKILFHFTSYVNFSGVDMITQKPNKGSNPDLSLPSLGKIDDLRNASFSDIITCGANGTQYLCSKYDSILWDTVALTANNEPIIDTMNFGTWFTFEVTRPLQVTFNQSRREYAYPELAKRQKAWLFNGKYGSSNFCELEPITIAQNNRMCLTEGIYTVFIGMFRNTLTARDSTYLGFLASNASVSLSIYKIDPVKADSAKFDDPLSPKHYDNVLDGNLETELIELERDWIYGPYREFEIDGILNQGHFSFYTFELKKDAYVYLWHNENSNQWGYSWRVFSGDCAQGLDSLKEYQTISYQGQPTQQLQKLTKGVYTILAYRGKGSLCNPPRNHQTKLALQATIKETPEPDPCKPKFQFAKTSAKLNNGSALKCTEPALSTLYTKYEFPVTCLNKVNNRGNQHWYNKSKHTNLADHFVYFEFEIKEKCNFKILSSQNYQLLKGSISTDSSIVNNGANVIVENTTYNYSDCAFKPGKYSVVINGNNSTY
ncbi:MAG: hypothetical protein ACPGLV_17465, partial [Bacteroidia bacterium]